MSTSPSGDHSSSLRGSFSSLRRGDRLLVLAALGAALLSLLVRFGSPNAGHADASPASTDLGPADALLLHDAKPSKKGSGTLSVRADGSRVTWSERPTSKAWAIGAVNVDKAMKALLASKSYADKRDEQDQEMKKQDEEFTKRLEALRGRYPNLAPDSPDVAKAQQEFNALREEYGQWRESSMRSREKVFAEQIEKAYRDLVNAVEIVSDREEIDIVVRFQPTALPFEADNLAGARDQVASRTFLKYPESIDLTADVLKELSIKE